jgi:hypothetical protein
MKRCVAPRVCRIFGEDLQLEGEMTLVSVRGGWPQRDFWPLSRNDKEIGAELFISERSVKSDAKSIFAKLNVIQSHPKQ